VNKSFLISVITGLISPIIFSAMIIVFYLDLKLSYFIEHKINSENLPAIISLSLLINLFLFFINIWKNQDIKSRGILFSTIVYGFFIVYLKFL